MQEQDHIAAPQLAGTIPMGRGLLPEELADMKAKGREWSRLFKEKRRKDFTVEQVEEKKLKNRRGSVHKYPQNRQYCSLMLLCKLAKEHYAIALLLASVTL